MAMLTNFSAIALNMGPCCVFAACFAGPVAEQVLLLENIATSIKTGPDQLPTVYNLLLEAVRVVARAALQQQDARYSFAAASCSTLQQAMRQHAGFIFAAAGAEAAAAGAAPARLD
jgi:hypothetical protein